MQNLQFVAHLDELSARTLLLELGLEIGKPVREFSGGMKRRLALARALLADSDALALDEPFTGLDEQNRIKSISCIRKMTVEKPVLLVTHNPDDVSKLNAKLIRL